MGSLRFLRKGTFSKAFIFMSECKALTSILSLSLTLELASNSICCFPIFILFTVDHKGLSIISFRSSQFHVTNIIDTFVLEYSCYSCSCTCITYCMHNRFYETCSNFTEAFISSCIL